MTSAEHGQYTALKDKEIDMRKWISFYEKSNDHYRIKQYTKYLGETLHQIEQLGK